MKPKIDQSIINKLIEETKERWDRAEAMWKKIPKDPNHDPSKYIPIPFEKPKDNK